jgi:hypothetical protein
MLVVVMTVATAAAMFLFCHRDPSKFDFYI